MHALRRQTPGIRDWSHVRRHGPHGSALGISTFGQLSVYGQVSIIGHEVQSAAQLPPSRVPILFSFPVTYGPFPPAHLAIFGRGIASSGDSNRKHLILEVVAKGHFESGVGKNPLRYSRLWWQRVEAART